jgi:hypothetical protein
MGGEGFSTAVLRGVTAIDLSITVFRCYICAALQTDVAGIMYATCLVSDVAMTWPYTLCVEHGRSKITQTRNSARLLGSQQTYYCMEGACRLFHLVLFLFYVHAMYGPLPNGLSMLLGTNLIDQVRWINGSR